jgi:hypothetical protein
MSGDQEWSPYNCLATVFQPVRAGFFGAMDAAIDMAAGFDAMSNNPAITVWASRRQHVNRTLEAVKGSRLSR